MPSCSATSSFVTPWTAAHQAPLSMGFSRQEHWRGVLFPPPGHLPNPGIKPRSPSLQADSLPSEPQGSPRTLEWGDYCFSRGSSRPTNQTGLSPALQADSLPVELPGKPCRKLLSHRGKNQYFAICSNVDTS